MTSRPPVARPGNVQAARVRPTPSSSPDAKIGLIVAQGQIVDGNEYGEVIGGDRLSDLLRDARDEEE